MSIESHTPAQTTLLHVLGDEGFRIFFPLAALYAGLWPAMWVIALGLDLPLAHAVPPSLWHAHEMLVGAFGAALIGFLTTAIPEWTDTPKLKHCALWALAGLWAVGRLVGIWGWDGAGAIGAVADLSWMLALIFYATSVSIRRRTDRLLAFIMWLSVLTLLLASTRIYFGLERIAQATEMLYLFGIAFTGLLGLALARVTVPVTNLILDPTERTSPFRAHPGRRHLASGLILLAVAGQLAGLSAAAEGYLLIAAGAAYMDRVAEGFIGRAMLRVEVLMLTLSSGLAGVGLILLGAARLGAPLSEVSGLHVIFMGGLGMGVLAVLSIAGLMHAGQKLHCRWQVKAACALIVLAVLWRVLPDLTSLSLIAVYEIAALLWAVAFGLWLAAYWPLMRDPRTCETGC